MAATNYTPIQLYNSGTASVAPTNTNLAAGELALNYKDGLLYYKDDANVVQKIGYKLVPIANGGTGATTSATAPFALKGANSDITSLSGLTTALSVAQGGIGVATLAANNVLLGNGTSAPLEVAPSNSGNVLTSNGTIWTSAASMTVAVVTTTSQTAVAGTHYVLTNVSATNVNLPAGTSGDTVWITWTNTLATNTVTPNGAGTIMGAAGAMTLNTVTNGTVQLRFVNSSWRIL